MHKNLVIQKHVLERARSDEEYLYEILSIYDPVWYAESQKFLENFSDDQIALFIYGTLHGQVMNGGFLQLIFNGYAPYVFASPLASTLRAWGASSTADLIDAIADVCLQVDRSLRDVDKSNLESFTNLYTQYPEFSNYDNAFCENDGMKEVKAYVSENLAVFIMVE